MAEQLTPDEEKALADLAEAVAVELAEGKSKETIVKELVKQEWPEESAIQFVDQVEQELARFKESPEGSKGTGKPICPPHVMRYSMGYGWYYRNRSYL